MSVVKKEVAASGGKKHGELARVAVGNSEAPVNASAVPQDCARLLVDDRLARITYVEVSDRIVLPRIRIVRDTQEGIIFQVHQVNRVTVVFSQPQTGRTSGGDHEALIRRYRKLEIISERRHDSFLRAESSFESAPHKEVAW